MTGVIIGRFQVPHLHLGHIYLIAHSLHNYNDTIILLGCLPFEEGEVDERNPYTEKHRVDAIKRLFPHVRMYPLYDKPGDDEKWSRQIDMLIKDEEDPVLLHSRDSFKDYYKGKYPTLEIPELPGFSGTKLREALKPNK